MKFVRLLQEEGECIISKVTSHDSTTNKLKDAAWKKITAMHNSDANIVRTTDTLKKLWGKLKSEAKTFKATSRRSVTGTGGGPAIKFEDPVLELVADVTGRGSTGILNIDDCDAVAEITTNNTEENESANAEKTDYEDVKYLDDSIFLEEDEFPDENKIIVVSEEGDKAIQPGSSHQNTNTNYVKKNNNYNKRRQPIIEDKENERSKLEKKRNESSNRFASERLKAEREKSALIIKQREQLEELHAIKMENENLKKQLLQVLLKKVSEADSKEVVKEAAKFVLSD